MTKLRLVESCWMCHDPREGELRGDDDCRYYFFHCVVCGTKWSRLAPAVTPDANEPTKLPKGDKSGGSKDKA